MTGEERQVTERAGGLLERLWDADAVYRVTQSSEGSLWGDAAEAIERSIAVLSVALSHFIHLDQSNAATHCGTVRFSPLTFRLAEVAAELGHTGSDVDLVLGHAGRYEEDRGR